MRRAIWHRNHGEKRRTLRNSLPKREEGTDVIPDDVRRTDPAQRILPDSLPPLDEQSIERADGGVARRPIHEHDL